MPGEASKSKSPTFPEWVEQGKRFWVAAVTIAALGASGTYAWSEATTLKADLAAAHATSAEQQEQLEALQAEVDEASQQLAVLETLAALLREELTRGGGV